MNKIKKAVATLGVTAMLLIGGATAAQAATSTQRVYYVGNYTYEVWYRVDYNFWEELAGKKDYSYFSHYKYCPPGRLCVF